MKIINKIKLSIGLLFCLISLLGSIPIINSNLIKNKSYYNIQSFASQSLSKNLNDTNYPVYLGLFAVAGAIILGSIKEK